MIIVSRKKALAEGLKQYFTGKACKHGHVTFRYTSNKACVDCLQRWCNSEEYKTYKLAECKKNAEYYRDKTRKWRKANLSRHNSNNARRRAKQFEATVSWANKEEIDRIYALSRWISNLYNKPFHVDHIVPLKGKTVCGLHVENNLQILEASKNVAKSNKLIEEHL